MGRIAPRPQQQPDTAQSVNIYDTECTLTPPPEEQSRKIWRDRRCNVLDRTE